MKAATKDDLEDMLQGLHQIPKQLWRVPCLVTDDDLRQLGLLVVGRSIEKGWQPSTQKPAKKKKGKDSATDETSEALSSQSSISDPY